MGGDIKESTLSSVPKAAHADSATTASKADTTTTASKADTATTATKANTAISWEGETELLAFNYLGARCLVAGDIHLWNLG